MKLYLVGAIRDGRVDDITWRERVIENLGRFHTILNPLAGKSFIEEEKRWVIHGELAPSGAFLVKHDFFMVDQADVIVANMLALGEGYPNIGSLMELGRATATGRKLIYMILPSKFAGHTQNGMYALHPFLAENAAGVFTSVDACIEFLREHLDVLDGQKPHYGGTR